MSVIMMNDIAKRRCAIAGEGAHEVETVEVTATELKQNLGKYLDLVREKNIVVTRNGERVTTMLCERAESERWLDGIHQIAEEARQERIRRDGCDRFSAEAAAQHYEVAEKELTDEMMDSYLEQMDNEARFEYMRKRGRKGMNSDDTADIA